ncbi:deoxyribonuclease IV [Candidatus Dependentiae bacterium]|nr:MAG: deoxyribonuclease IV [Candidatus Dependentiae bacterium]
MINSRVGFHLRLHTSASAVARTAKALKLPFFQFFLQAEKDSRLFFLSAEDEKTFLSMRSSFSSLYVHSSYRFDIAITQSQRHEHLYNMLAQEIRLAIRLQATHYVLHPGTIQVGKEKQDMLASVSQRLNHMLKTYPEIIFCVENTANPKRLLGAMLEDLFYINERIATPERFGFCIDTAHLHAAGYALHTVEQRLAFFEKLKKSALSVLLVHLNDTTVQCGSFIDRHAELGKGVLGRNVLHNFATNEFISNVPLLIESPELSFDMMQKLLQETKEW